MKNKPFSYLFICLLFFSSCKKSEAQNTDQGQKKHPQPSIALFPQAAAYDSSMPLSGSLKDSLDKTTQSLFKITGMPGLTAAMLVSGKGLWQTDTGYRSKPDQQKVNVNTVFYWASVCKLLTATVIEQLIQEQKLNYDSKLSTWFPRIHDASKITVDQLLQHTSGIYSFNNDPTIFAIDRYYAPDELIGLSQAQKKPFPAGQSMVLQQYQLFIIGTDRRKGRRKTL
jgi:D-alanyl-D-alanine carboxypeptidase